jgi:hAT family protein
MYWIVDSKLVINKIIFCIAVNGGGTPSVVFQLYTGHKSAEWVLQWWQTKQAEYPCMACATRDYLPIPASKVDTCVERTFSDGRDILGIRRWRMKGNTFRVEIT